MAAFEVLADSAIPAPGDQAPLIRQPLANDAAVDPKSIDSRAASDRPIPDLELHDITIADAITAGRPTVVVISTPTFRVSRFCGPITPPKPSGRPSNPDYETPSSVQPG